MDLRKISPLRETNRDLAWTRWDKMAISCPRPTVVERQFSRLKPNPAIRIRQDGVIYNIETDEYFQADAEMLEFLEGVQAPFDINSENDQGLRNAVQHGLLVACE